MDLRDYFQIAPLEIFVEMRPVAGQIAGHRRVERPVVGFQVASRGGGDAAIAHDLCGDALAQRAQRAAVEGDGQVGMRVAVYKTGAGDMALGVDVGEVAMATIRPSSTAISPLKAGWPLSSNRRALRTRRLYMVFLRLVEVFICPDSI